MLYKRTGIQFLMVVLLETELNLASDLMAFPVTSSPLFGIEMYKLVDYYGEFVLECSCIDLKQHIHK